MAAAGAQRTDRSGRLVGRLGLSGGGQRALHARERLIHRCIAAARASHDAKRSRFGRRSANQRAKSGSFMYKTEALGVLFRAACAKY
jgi:hypothetical protein